MTSLDASRRARTAKQSEFKRGALARKSKLIWVVRQSFLEFVPIRRAEVSVGGVLKSQTRDSRFNQTCRARKSVKAGTFFPEESKGKSDTEIWFPYHSCF